MRCKVIIVVTLVLATVAIGTAFAQTERQGGQVFVTDPNPASSNPAGGVGTEIVADGGFEAGSPNPNWTEQSDAFGTPLCTTGLCGTGGGTAGPAGGSWWAWFGGIGAAETASVSQTVQGGAADACTLSFSLWIGTGSGNGSDSLDVSIAGGTVFSVLEDNTNYPAYTPVVLDVSGAIDGTPQVLSFDYVGLGPGVTNFNVDDVSLTCQAGVPTTPRWGLLLLAVLLTVGALTVWRRQVAAR